jgi:hypothetical protein
MRRSKHFDAKNQRRVELIHKKHLGGGLTVEEDVELETLQKWVGDYVNKRHPIDFSVIEELERYRLKREANENKTARETT